MRAFEAYAGARLCRLPARACAAVNVHIHALIMEGVCVADGRPLIGTIDLVLELPRV